MSEASIAKKAEAVKNVNAMLTAAETGIVVDYRGLTGIRWNISIR